MKRLGLNPRGLTYLSKQSLKSVRGRKAAIQRPEGKAVVEWLRGEKRRRGSGEN